jgi:hypothetical protein
MSVQTCPRTGKECLTRKDAMAKDSWWRRARLARMNHYKCATCGAWHVGHNLRKPTGR